MRYAFVTIICFAAMIGLIYIGDLLAKREQKRLAAMTEEERYEEWADMQW